MRINYICEPVLLKVPLKAPVKILLQLMLAAVLYFCTISSANASSYWECRLKVDILDLNANNNLNSIESLHVTVVSKNHKLSRDCPFESGQEILIKEITHKDIHVSELDAGVSLQVYYRYYSDKIDDGDLFIEEQWSIVELSDE